MDLPQVIAEVESGSDPKALRFEGLLYDKWFARIQTNASPSDLALLDRIKEANRCSRLTALMIASTSWGAYQLLGENLYDDHVGFTGRVIDYLGDAVAQLRTFQRFTIWRDIVFSLDDIQNVPRARDLFIQRYNGPGDPPAYWQRMQLAMIRLRSGPAAVSTGTAATAA